APPQRSPLFPYTTLFRSARVVGVELIEKPVRGAEQLAVDVDLALIPRAIADPDWPGVAPATQMRQLPLGQVLLAADTEHDLQFRSEEHTSELQSRSDLVC